MEKVRIAITISFALLTLFWMENFFWLFVVLLILMFATAIFTNSNSLYKLSIYSICASLIMLLLYFFTSSTGFIWLFFLFQSFNILSFYMEFEQGDSVLSSVYLEGHINWYAIYFAKLIVLVTLFTALVYVISLLTRDYLSPLLLQFSVLFVAASIFYIKKYNKISKQVLNLIGSILVSYFLFIVGITNFENFNVLIFGGVFVQLFGISTFYIDFAKSRHDKIMYVDIDSHYNSQRLN